MKYQRIVKTSKYAFTRETGSFNVHLNGVYYPHPTEIHEYNLFKYKSNISYAVKSNTDRGWGLPHKIIGDV